MPAKPLRGRRKPVQARAQATQTAILDAFVRLLQEKPFAALTVREIADVAGVGLGTLYEHFPGKRALAAHCVHLRFKQIGERMQACSQAHKDVPLPARVDAVLDLVWRLHAQAPAEWSALAQLERGLDELAAFRRLYTHFVDIWAKIIAIDAEPHADVVAIPQVPLAKFSDAREAVACDGHADRVWRQAEVVHAAVYGLIYQTLLWQPERVTEYAFRVELGRLVQAYLAIQSDAVPGSP